jgi:hypothetical protein
MAATRHDGKSRKLVVGNQAGRGYLSHMNVQSDLIIATGVGPIDLAQVAKVARETGSVSPPQFARTMQFDLPKAEVALADLAERGYLELSPESGLVRTYNVTRNAYDKIETGRSRRSIFSGIFEHHDVSGTRG